MTTTDPIDLTVWVVDDDIADPKVSFPILNCFRGFVAQNIAKIQSIVERDISPAHYSTKKRTDLRWIKAFEVANEHLMTGHVAHTRSLRILVFGIEAWETVIGCVARDKRSDLTTCFPALVMTDLYKGERDDVQSENALLGLPGAKLATTCAQRQIPCIVFTSGDQALKDYHYLWNSLQEEHRSLLASHPREHVGLDGQVVKRLSRLWKHSLHRRLWIPEFEYVVSGTRNNNTQTFHVTFASASGRVVSDIAEVPAIPYAHLYLWAYASKLARLKDWEAFELENIQESKCPILSPLAELPGAANTPNIYSNVGKIFSPSLSNEDRTKLCGPKGKPRAVNLLKANIVHLDTPSAGKIPTYWCDRTLVRNIKRSMREILPTNGWSWLNNVLPK